MNLGSSPSKIQCGTFREDVRRRKKSDENIMEEHHSRQEMHPLLSESVNASCIFSWIGRSTKNA